MLDLRAKHFISVHLRNMSFLLKLRMNFSIYMKAKLSVKPLEDVSLHRCFHL